MRSEAYLDVRRNDEGCGQRRRWTFFSSLLEDKGLGMKDTKNAKDLLAENEDLRYRLEEALDTLRAIRSGEVDGLVVSTAEGDRIFNLSGADHP